MTEQEIESVVSAIDSLGLESKRFPKKLEIKIPRAKFPGIYLSIPIDIKSFKLLVYCHQASFAFLDKLSVRGYKMVDVDLDKTFAIKEVKGIPTEEEIVEYLSQGLEDVVTIGIVRPIVPEMV